MGQEKDKYVGEIADTYCRRSKAACFRASAFLFLRPWNIWFSGSLEVDCAVVDIVVQTQDEEGLAAI